MLKITLHVTHKEYKKLLVAAVSKNAPIAEIAREIFVQGINDLKINKTMKQLRKIMRKVRAIQKTSWDPSYVEQ